MQLCQLIGQNSNSRRMRRGGSVRSELPAPRLMSPGPLCAGRFALRRRRPPWFVRGSRVLAFRAWAGNSFQSRPSSRLRTCRMTCMKCATSVAAPVRMSPWLATTTGAIVAGARSGSFARSARTSSTRTARGAGAATDPNQRSVPGLPDAAFYVGLMPRFDGPSRRARSPVE